jgi:DNA-binding transcriptional MerR regulator
MFKIGDFSRLARVSARQLRFYEEIGLFAPSHTDRQTGYRYYKASQLAELSRILVLKELGLSLEQIGRVVREGLPASELRGMLMLRRAEAERALDEQAERLRQIENRIAQIEAAGRLELDDVLLRPEPAQRLLSLRQTVPSLVEGIKVIGELAAAVPRAVGPAALGNFVAIAHSADFEPDSIDVEFGFYLQREVGERVALPDGRVLTTRDLPAAERVAACVRVGSAESAHLTTARIGHYLEENGYRIAGPNREVFLQRPRAEAVREWVVEMQFPVEKA